MLTLETPIEHFSGIGSSYAKRLENLAIKTVGDLIHHYPFRYDDFAEIKTIDQAQVGEEVTIVGTLWDIGNVYTKSHKILTKGVVQDGTGTIEVVWFNQRYLTQSLKTGMRISLSGKVQQNGYKLQLISPAYEVLDDNMVFVNTGRLVPIYPETAGISSRWLRSRIMRLLPMVNDQLRDWLPEHIRSNAGVETLPQAVQKIHFPSDKLDVQRARKRIAFDELLKVHLTALKRKHQWQSRERDKQLTIDQKQLAKFIKSLPFELTKAQERVVDEILSDLAKAQPMNRLLEGDVGSGKTVVAAIAMYVAHLNDVQSALMAPTAILANQHYETLMKLFTKTDVTVSLVTSTSKRQTNQESGITNQGKAKTQKSVNPDSKFQIHDSSIVVGTHAVLSESSQFKNLGLIVIDEQHKFGVQQRGLLRKKGNTPHVLTMTATPIPRTLALTLYGNLDLSVIDEMPAGRTKVNTHVVPQTKRNDAYAFIAKQIKDDGVQAFVVCPLIEESETYATAKAATIEYEHLKNDIFPGLHLGLLHGRMKPKEKDVIMAQFQKQELDILVATPLVEVGVDIPHATIMVIEAADRFGLAQLHQFRGRVGRRANQKAYCLLFTELRSPHAYRRLRTMETVYNGLELAEIDLTYRGAGEIFGTKQHGVENFKVAKLSDLKLIEETRLIAQKLFSDYYLKGDRGVVQIVDQSDQRLVEAN